jgi:hypothetical protein
MDVLEFGYQRGIICCLIPDVILIVGGNQTPTVQEVI